MSTTDVIVPYAGGEPGTKAAPPIAIPYEGGAVRQTPESQRAAAAAVELSQVDTRLTSAITGQRRGINNIDPASQERLNELRIRMRQNPPRPATIINLHPWPLQYSGTDLYLKGLRVEACNPGQPYAYQHIRGYRVEKEYNEDGSFIFREILPIRLAAQFLIDFANKDAYGGGIVIYEGDSNPEKTGKVAIYDQAGRMQTTVTEGYEYDEEERRVPAIINTPITAELHDLIEKSRKARNAYYLKRVQVADHDYHLPDGRGKALVNDIHRLMAQMLVAEGVLSTAPVWDLAGSIENDLKDRATCASCGAFPKPEAFKCVACGHIILPFEAYMAGAITSSHASLELIDGETWELVLREDERRRQQKARGRELLKETKKEEKEAAQGGQTPATE